MASGDISLPGTTICIAGMAVAVNCSSVTNVDRSARPSAASAYALLTSLSFAKTIAASSVPQKTINTQIFWTVLPVPQKTIQYSDLCECLIQIQPPGP